MLTAGDVALRKALRNLLLLVLHHPELVPHGEEGSPAEADEAEADEAPDVKDEVEAATVAPRHKGRNGDIEAWHLSKRVHDVSQSQ